MNDMILCACGCQETLLRYHPKWGHERKHIKGHFNRVQRGKNAHWYGRKLPEATKQKISEALRGRIISEEWRRKISEAQIGKKFSKERSENHRRRIHRIYGDNISDGTARNKGRRVYQEHYKITLLPEVDIHHIDHNPQNNEISNLSPMIRSNHMKYHRRRRLLV